MTLSTEEHDRPRGVTHMTDPSGVTFRPPRVPIPVSVIWAISPAIIMLTAVLLFGRDWPHLKWTVFIGGVLNMGIFSLWQLWSREVESWEFKSIPFAMALLLGNALIVVIASMILGIPIGTPASPPPAPMP